MPVWGQRKGTQGNTREGCMSPVLDVSTGLSISTLGTRLSPPTMGLGRVLSTGLLLDMLGVALGG